MINRVIPIPVSWDAANSDPGPDPIASRFVELSLFYLDDCLVDPLGPCNLDRSLVPSL
jgi:hypothetical protein